MKNTKGFTLLELTVVIAIMGVLAVVSVPTLTQYINRSEVEFAKRIVNNFCTAS